MLPETVVFFHAHPDDEAIFTGGTIAMLSELGIRVVVVFATRGERGTCSDGSGKLESIREQEAVQSCSLLGAEEPRFLGYVDTGMGDGPVDPGSFALANIYEASEALAHILRSERASTLVHYDEGGIYGHVDHLAVHRVGRRAADLAGLDSVYESTVDHEHLHFVETHLVGHAISSLHEGAVAGVPTAIVTTTIDVGKKISTKRASMSAHPSQIEPESEVMLLDADLFRAVYGHEWYIRTGPPGILDRLAI